ncbi:MAG: TIGR02266 family protein [Polyangiales bacterium]
MADTRKDTRAPISLKVRFKSATVDEFIEHYSKDVSRGGIYIKSSQPLPVGTLLKFQFQLKDESALIRGVGRVVWTRAEADAAADMPAGMGIKFIKMDTESRATVERIIESHSNEGGTYESGRFNATSAEPFGSEPTLDNHAEHAEHEPEPSSGAAFFPNLAPAELPPPEDRTAVRQATQLLAAVLAGGGTDEAAAREAEQKAEEARRRTAEIEAERQREREQQRRPAERAPVPSVQGSLPSMIVDAALAPRPPRASQRDELPGDRTPLPRQSDAMLRAARAQAAHLDEPDTEPPSVPPAGSLDGALEGAPDTTQPTVTTSIPDIVGKKRGFFPIAVIASLLLIALVVALRGGPRDASAPTSEPVRDERAEAPPNAAPTEPPQPSTAEQPAEVPSTAREQAEAVAPAPVEPAAPAPEEAKPAQPAEGALVPVDVVTAPPGAEIYVGTELRGSAPLTLELSEGAPVIVRARAPGHAEISQQVIPKAKNAGLKLRLPPLMYLVEVITTPPGAAVNVGGLRGTAPAEIKLSDALTGEASVSARLEGYTLGRARLLPRDFSERDGAMRAEVNIKLAPVLPAGGGREGSPEPAPAPRKPARPAAERAPAAPKEEAAPREEVAPKEAPPEPKPAPKPKEDKPKEDIPDNPFGD